MQSFLLFDVSYNHFYILFIGSATSLLYALHRLVGIDLVGRYKYTGRFGKIYKMRLLLLFIGLVTAVLTWIFFLKLGIKVQVTLIVPGIISILYVLPIFAGKRLRDLPLIKIFLVAIVYAYVCVFIPGMMVDFHIYPVLLLFFGRLFFIFGITIPFDIRDVNIDGETEVKTLISQLGIKSSKGLAIGMLILALTLSWIFISYTQLPFQYVIPEITVHIICILLVYYANAHRSDFYYAFLLDGTMGLFVIIHGLLA
jgi:4-hydroxybenzoate polyprenyltransferase